MFNPNSSRLLTVGETMDVISVNAMLTMLCNPIYLDMVKVLRLWRYKGV